MRHEPYANEQISFESTKVITPEEAHALKTKCSMKWKNRKNTHTISSLRGRWNGREQNKHEIHSFVSSRVSQLSAFVKKFVIVAVIRANMIF